MSNATNSIGQTGSVDSLKASVRLTKAFGDVYDLYRAMMPVAHSNLISTVPSIGMQFSNDCLYIAREGGKIARGSKPTGAFSKDDQLALKKHFDALRLYGENVLEDQLVRKDLSRVCVSARLGTYQIRLNPHALHTFYSYFNIDRTYSVSR